MGLFRGASFTSRSERITAFQSTVCDFGTPVPLLYGTCKVAPNLMCYQDFSAQEKRTTQRSGKSSNTSITYLYYVYVELALGEGVISDIQRVWVGDTVYGSLSALNANSNNTGAGLGWTAGRMSGPTTYMSMKHPDIATGYSNLAYAYGKIFLGEDYGGIPSYSFEVRGTLVSSGDGVDANPAYVIKDILTKIGLGTYIDESSFENYASYCRNADLLISTPSDAFSSQKKAQEVIAEILELTNTYMFWSVDRFKFVVRDDVARGDWSPNTTVMYDITADDFIKQMGGAPVIFKRKDSTEIYNYITVNFLNRANEYEEESVSYQDISSIKTYGIRSKSYDAKWYHTKERALKYAQMKTRIAQTEANQYTMKLPWKYCRLEPGDLLRITDEAIGFDGQIVMVSEVTEDKTGILTVTAVQRAPGNYSEARYTVDDTYHYQDFNVEPGDTAKPLFIIPPSDLMTSANGCEVWVALRGETENWGGCTVYASDKDGDYNNIGTQGVSSLYGTITSALTADGTSVNIKLGNPRTVELLTGSTQDAANGNTLIWVNGECMSYTKATLLAANTYQLTGLIRGQYGTTAKAHAAGEDMALLDGGIYVVPLTKHYVGRTLYFKFPAFNAFKANSQSINELDYYTFKVATADIPNCTNVTAYNKYRDVGGTVVYHDIIVEWTPADFENYQQAQIWYKQKGGKNWQYGGSGYKSATLPQVDIGETYQIAVCTQDIYGNVETPDSSAQTSILVALSMETPNTPSSLQCTIKDAFIISWKDVQNADIKYYEVRLDKNVGVNSANFIARTGETSYATNAVTSRKGTIYVFAVSAYGQVSAPAYVYYNFPAPDAPDITVTAKLSGASCQAGKIPANCIGVHWVFNGTAYDGEDKTANRSYFKSLIPGIYDVKACYYDYFGDGEYSTTEITVKATIDAALLEAESISAAKLDAATQKALEDAKKTAEDLGVLSGNVYSKTETDTQISSSFTNFENGTLKSYATITQMNNAISLAVKNDIDGNAVITKINLADGTILLDGKYIHITGDTKIDGNIITSGMLQAGCVTADKMSVNTLSAITARIGTLKTADSGARTVIQDNLISVYDSSNTLRVRMGVW